MIGIEVSLAPLRDFLFVRIHIRPIESLAVECLGRAKRSGRLSRIKRRAGRVAVHVDDRSRDFRADRGRAKLARKIIEPVYPPIRVLSREPRRDKALTDLPGNVRAGMRKGED